MLNTILDPSLMSENRLGFFYSFDHNDDGTKMLSDCYYGTKTSLITFKSFKTDQGQNYPEIFVRRFDNVF